MLSSLLNKKITIEKGTTIKSSSLSTKPTYETYMSAWAGVYVRQGASEFGNTEQFLFTTEFTIRYNSLSKFINNKYRIIYNGEKYKIIEIIEVEPRQTLKLIGIHYGEQGIQV